MKTCYLECECGNFSHTFRLTHDYIDNSICLEVNLNHYLPWYKRVVAAVRYIFKMNRSHEHYDVTLLTSQSMEDLAYLADDYFSYHLPMTKDEAISLLEFVRAHPDGANVVKGAWLCNLQGTDDWVVDTMSHSDQFVRIHNHIKITPS